MGTIRGFYPVVTHLSRGFYDGVKPSIRVEIRTRGPRGASSPEHHGGLSHGLGHGLGHCCSQYISQHLS
jgi:hypothetical protein